MFRYIPNPYQTLYRTLIIGAFALNIPALFFLLSGNQLVTMFFGLAQFMMFVLGVMFLVTGKKNVRGILALINGKLLAHWTYEKSHWDVFAQEEYKRHKENAVTTLIAFLFAGPLAAFLGYKEMTMTDGIILGVVLGLFSYAIAMIHARSVLRNSLRPPYEAFISATAAYINGMFLDWASREIRFHDCSLANSDSGTSSLVIKYSVRGRRGTQQKEMFVPIPKEKMEEAASIVSTLNEKWKEK